MVRIPTLLAALCLMPGSGAALAAEAEHLKARTEFAEKHLQPFLKQHCLSCHAGAKPAGKVRLDQLTAAADWTEHHRTWLKVAEQLEGQSMPPAPKPKPGAEEYESLLGKLRPVLRDGLLASKRLPPPTPLRRLNRVQYRNVIRDLFAIDLDPTTQLPADETAFGFDNIGEALTVSPILMEQYLRMARMVAQQVIVAHPEDVAPVVAKLEWPADRHKGKGPSRYSGNKLDKPFDFSFEVPAEDDYLIKVQVLGENIGAEPLQAVVELNDAEAFRLPVAATEFTWMTRKLRLPAGPAKLTFRAVPPAKTEKPPTAPGQILIERVYIARPSQLRAEDYPAAHRHVMIAQPSADVTSRAAATSILRPLATRAYRRPVTDAQLDRLLRVVESSQKAGDRFEQSVQCAVQALLCSPAFLFLVEAERGPGADAALRPLDEHELASRLSFFLWNTMPDEELLAAADKGTLRQELDAQLERMIADRRFEQFSGSFTTQWLKLQRLHDFRPDPKNKDFAAFAEIRESMTRETELFFAAVVREDRSALELIDADFSVVDHALSKFYGLPAVDPKLGFQRVRVGAIKRGGLLTHASVLTATSYPTRTSPVLRGAFILENLLGAPPPPPPGDVPTLEVAAEKAETKMLTVRQQLEKHRANAGCAVCHNRIDPLGFALEHFNAIGTYRMKDAAGAAIDATAQLPTGETLKGLPDLKTILKTSKKEQFLTCLTEKLLTYALGRGLDPADFRTVHQLVADLPRREDRLKELLKAIVKTEAFNHR